MYVRIALAECRGYPISENFPEVIAAADEGTMLENPDWYQEQVEKAKSDWGQDMVAVRHFEIELPDALIASAFAPVTVTSTAMKVTYVDE